jgi:pimeloyl-ACP methyl ester carboxylesterase
VKTKRLSPVLGLIVVLVYLVSPVGQRPAVGATSLDAAALIPPSAVVSAAPLPAPPLTAEQLAALHGVTHWDIEYTATRMLQRTGNGAGTVGSFGLVSATIDVTERQSYSLRLTVEGIVPPGVLGECVVSFSSFSNPCVPILSDPTGPAPREFPASLVISDEGHHRTLSSWTNPEAGLEARACGRRGTQVLQTLDWSAAGSFTGGDQLSGSGEFYIKDEDFPLPLPAGPVQLNPPVAVTRLPGGVDHIGRAVGNVGPSLVTNTDIPGVVTGVLNRCGQRGGQSSGRSLSGIAPITTCFVRTGEEILQGVPPWSCSPEGDTQVRVEQGRFVIRGTASMTRVTTRDALDQLGVLVVPMTSTETFEAQWVVRARVDCSTGDRLCANVVDPNPDLINPNGTLIPLATLAARLKAPVRGVVADGVSKLLLVARTSESVNFSIVPDPIGLPAGGLGPFVSSGPASDHVLVDPTITDGGKSVAIAVYTPPGAFAGVAASPRIVTIRITKLSAPAAALEVPLEIRRPPVVLVHGLWSDPGVWRTGGFEAALRDRGFEVFKADYSGASAATFDPTANKKAGILSVKVAIQDALANERGRGIAATQVDVVAHSMGGLQTRGLIQQPDYRRKTNFQQGWIHRLITIGTPHLGSPNAQLLWDHRNDVIFNFRDVSPGGPPLTITWTDFMFLHGTPVDQGAIEALRPTSDALKHITATCVPSHAIGAVWHPGGIASHFAQEEIGKILTRDVTFQLDGPLGFGTPEHDVIVPLDSQMGRISATSLFESTVHSSNLVPASIAVDPSETSSAEVQQQVATLLSSTGAPNFDPCFPAPVSVAPLARIAAEPATQRAMVSAAGVTAASATQKQIRIVQPVDGTVVSLVSGSSVTVAVEASGGATVQRMLLFIGNLGMVVAPNVLPAQIVVPIPRDAPVGQMKIAAIALDVSGDLLGGVTSVELKAPAPPVKLTVEPRRLTLTPEVPARQLRVSGTFTWDATSHVDRDVTLASQGTIYRAVNGESVVHLSPDGIVTAVRAGSDIIEVRNGGQVVLVEVTSAPAPVDVTSPITTATPSPAANANGWNTGDVAVSLGATDETGGSGVREIHYTLTSGATTTSLVVPGASASVLVSPEGTSALDFFASDNAGNVEATKHLTIRIDRTPPTITGARAPAANAAGWNNTDVTVTFSCADLLSGIASCAGPIALSTEGANQSATGTTTDKAGLSASLTVSGINIDKTAPHTTANASPPANAAGWNRGDVAVTLAATDALSGVARTEFSLDGSPLRAYTASIAITGEGIHSLRFLSTDRADNLETMRELVVRIDLTPPEASIRFDPAALDLVVFARDGGSGPTATTAVVPTVAVTAADKRSRQSYRIEDRAGNTLDVVIDVTRERPDKNGDDTNDARHKNGDEHDKDGGEKLGERGDIKATVVSLRYNAQAEVAVPKNEIAFEWSLTGTALKELEQRIEFGEKRKKQDAEARFDAKKNETSIEVKDRAGERTFIRPGLVLLRLETDRGTLAIRFD